MKPRHVSGYSPSQTDLCEQTLITLLRGLGPWKKGIYLAGGLVPRYLVPAAAPPHAGTNDVDLVLDLALLAEVDAYRRLEQNLKHLGFQRGLTDRGRAQHFSWKKGVGPGQTIVVDLLCDAGLGTGGQVSQVPRERRLSAIRIPGAHLVAMDSIEVPITAELLDGRGVATESVRVANVVPFIVLKALAYEDRAEQKDAYDLLHVLMNWHNGPVDVAMAFAERLRQWPEERLLPQTVEILGRRFGSDKTAPGFRKDGPVSYASFVSGPEEEDPAIYQQQASSMVELFLHQLAVSLADR